MPFSKVGAPTCVLVAMSGPAACGSDESDSPSSGATSQTTVPGANAPKGDPIKLGFICSCSGPQKAVIAKAQDVARVWANHVNDTGGINGSPDAKSTPEDVKKGLYALKGETLGGLSAPLTFTEGKPFFSPCWFTMTIAGGTPTSENANKPTCLPPDQAAALLKAAAG